MNSHLNFKLERLNSIEVKNDQVLIHFGPQSSISFQLSIFLLVLHVFSYYLIGKIINDTFGNEVGNHGYFLSYLFGLLLLFLSCVNYWVSLSIYMVANFIIVIFFENTFNLEYCLVALVPAHIAFHTRCHYFGDKLELVLKGRKYEIIHKNSIIETGVFSQECIIIEWTIHEGEISHYSVKFLPIKKYNKEITFSSTVTTGTLWSGESLDGLCSELGELLIYLNVPYDNDKWAINVTRL